MIYLCFALFLSSGHSAENQAVFTVFPSKVLLRDPWDSQKIVVYRSSAGLPSEQMKNVRITFEPANLATSFNDTVRPASDGKGLVIIDLNGWRSTIPLVVEGQNQVTVPDFKDQVEPVITGLGCNSGSCHGALAGKGGFKLSLRAYDPASDHHAMVFQMLGRRIDRDDASQSLLLKKALGEIPHGGGKKLLKDSVEHALFQSWIRNGAPTSKNNLSQYVGLEVLPAAIRLPRNASSEVVVMGKLRDGSSRDVTRLAKFSSANEAVASVNAEGMVTAVGNGETAVSVWFNNMVAVGRIQIPYPKLEQGLNKVAFKPVTWIDSMLLAKWNELNIDPSSGITDDQFLRRLWLDCLGILPSPQVLTEFRADNRPQKRERWIDKALSSGHFVDYWTYKWSDLFLVRSGRLQQSAVWSFHQSIRESVRSNRGWDKVARGILLANGSTLGNGFGNFYVIHRDPAELAESVSVTFLGQSIACAKCHNHPLEKWTQDQYWGFANLFGRIGLKSGDVDGEMLVVPQSLGDVPHLRTGKPVPPAPLDGREIDNDFQADRRGHFVNWLLEDENPYFARTQVNRLWRHFFSRGLVEPDDDLRQTNPSVLDDLLGRLAHQFRKSGYDNKIIIREILRSQAYQLSSVNSRNNETDEWFFSRYYPRRMMAEVLLDAYTDITEVPSIFDGVTPGGGNGTTKYGGYPLGMRAIQLPDVAITSQFLDSFGRPERLQACSCERANDTGVAQVLQMANGKILNEKISHRNNVITKGLDSGVPPENLVKYLFRYALSRDPTKLEMASLSSQLSVAPVDKKKEVLEDFFWAVLSSKEFLLIN